MNPQGSRSSTFSRRTVLSTAALAGGGVLLAGCGPSGGSGSNPSGGAAAAELPTFIEATVPPPDLPGSAGGVQPGYLTFPTDLTVAVPKPPGSGEPLRAMVITYNPPAPGSQYIAAVNEALNAPIDFEFVPDAEYETRFATASAGGDLPELIQLPVWANLPRLGEFLEATCVDLTDHLSGDRVATYPNLAALPTLTWRNARINGRIWGVPKANNPFPRATFYRKDIVDARGLELPTNADEFLQFCQQVTDPGRGEYAIAAANTGAYGPFPMFLIKGMFRVPTLWRLDDSGLTYYIESEEFAEALAYTRQLWEAGVYHPDSPTMTGPQANDLFASGRSVIIEDGNGAWKPKLQGTLGQNPDLEVGAIVPFGHDGGEGSSWMDPGAFSFVAITKRASERVEETLGIINYTAAPFGTVEEQLLAFGVEGTHFENTDAGPALNDLGKKEVYNSYRFLSGASGYLFYAGQEEKYTKPYHVWQTEIEKIMVPDPTHGHYSETWASKKASLNQLILDDVVAMVLGRKDLAALDDLRATWASQGGDNVRREFEQSIEAGE